MSANPIRAPTGERVSTASASSNASVRWATLDHVARLRYHPFSLPFLYRVDGPATSDSIRATATKFDSLYLQGSNGKWHWFSFHFLFLRLFECLIEFVQVNLCEPNPCGLNQKCIDHGTNISCECIPGLDPALCAEMNSVSGFPPLSTLPFHSAGFDQSPTAPSKISNAVVYFSSGHNSRPSALYNDIVVRQAAKVLVTKANSVC